MLDAKDPAIKLFGKTIPLSDGAGESQLSYEVVSCEQFDSQETLDANETASTDDNPKTPTADNEFPSSNTPNTEEEQNEIANSQDNKTFKKPDKILPCPRCNSMETKFCYFNNYNVTQPRYFCKKCQRYWTAGGTMRNVPIGAGRRKNKNSSPHYRHVSVSEALQNARVVAHYATVRPNGTVMAFQNRTYEPVNLGILEKNLPDCARIGFQEPANLKSLEKTVQDCARNRFQEPAKLNITEKTIHDCVRSGFREPLNLKVPEKPFQGCVLNEFHETLNLKVPVPYGGVSNCDDQFRTSSITTKDIKKESDDNKTGNVQTQMQNFQIPVFASQTWPYNTSHWVPPPGVYPIPFYPAPPYWGCTIQPPWPFPWVTMPLTTNPISPTLGKHSRNEDSTRQSEMGEGKKDSGSERSLWFPKTLRIDDPGEAAKNSILATLGINHNKCELSSGGGKGSIFKAFNSRADKERDTYDNTPVLQANPAALSRSRSFQEHS